MIDACASCAELRAMLAQAMAMLAQKQPQEAPRPEPAQPVAQPPRPRRVRPDVPGEGLSAPARRVAAAIVADGYLAGIVVRPNELAIDLLAAGPGLDVPLEVAQAGAWLRANPARKKVNGARFLLGWVTRNQERAHIPKANLLPFPSRRPGPLGSGLVSPSSPAAARACPVPYHPEGCRCHVAAVSS